MRLLSALAGALMLTHAANVRADDGPRISGPFTHQNLAVYFVHGTSAQGPVPLTLEEALGKGTVEVVETGSVNELKIRNTGDAGVFIQSGDIVKGGRQDRVITVSFLLPPKSGDVPLASFCVEAGRWHARGQEDAGHFASSQEAMPSRAAKLAMKAPLSERAVRDAGSETGERQRKVWEEVAKTQDKLSKGVNQEVNSAASRSSLQLSLENKKLQAVREDYIKALDAQGTKEDDVIGYVFAVNGRLNSGDLYPSNALFRKMWSKLLAASVTEAIGESGEKAAAAAQDTPPDVSAVKEFLAKAEKGKPSEQDIAGLAHQNLRDSEASLFVEVQTSKGGWVHRSYVKK